MTESAWNEDDLAQIDQHGEVHIAAVRPDGALTRPRTIWAVNVDGRVYIRSVNGAGSGWFRATRDRHEGRLTAGRMAKDVRLVDIDHADGIEQRIDAAYRAKYRDYPGPVERITAEQARATTLELTPR